ncbi:GSCFA domain-containing protein [Falsiroseomonas oryziterrae]|uniref:GSCFA domain-containing protein n=1 Tax=Falsiroseomonas oryziterrae TaxID=2911368 RepID=UPI001F1EBCCA|nr:GSCFA domain-containing protein [Roseomonas sp. NPKOSM-4]
MSPDRPVRHEHPYARLPDRHFWRRTAAAWAAGEAGDIYRPKFSIDRDTPIATAGSCFAQHVTRALRKAGCNLLDVEPAPGLLPPDRWADFGYGLYSARYGNIYTARQLRNLVEAALGRRAIEEAWEQGGRWFDPMRPAIEPGGFGSEEEMRALRRAHHAAIRRLIEQAGLLVFTLGLTECWMNAVEGHAYPVCPGTVAGEFDPARHIFRNLTVAEVVEDLRAVLALGREVNPALRLLLTVSPVPLVATATDAHVVVATAQAKAVLRAAAAEVAAGDPGVDYFPSFELVTSHLSGDCFEADRRNVRAGAVERVMACFLGACGLGVPVEALPSAAGPAEAEDADEAEAMRVICDEVEIDPELASAR